MKLTQKDCRPKIINTRKKHLSLKHYKIWHCKITCHLWSKVQWESGGVIYVVKFNERGEGDQHVMRQTLIMAPIHQFQPSGKSDLEIGSRFHSISLCSLSVSLSQSMLNQPLQKTISLYAYHLIKLLVEGM